MCVLCICHVSTKGQRKTFSFLIWWKIYLNGLSYGILYLFVCLFIFQDMVSLRITDLRITYSVHQAGLRDLSISASQVLKFKPCVPSSLNLFKKFCFLCICAGSVGGISIYEV